MATGDRLRELAERLLAQARPPLPADLVPLVIRGHRVGRARPDVARFLASADCGFVLDDGELRLNPVADERECSERLAQAANALRTAGLLSGWRDELLSVQTSMAAPVLGVIERSACRALGLGTTAVHLNAYSDDGRVVVARRAAHKQIDPGCWDSLVGGMVPHGETLEQALEREAWEEAGIELDRIEVHHGRSFEMLRPVAEGVQSERIHVFDAALAADAAPVNQDGEVDAIEHRSVAEVVDSIERGEFTLEAALVMLESLTRRAGVPPPPGLFV